MYQHRFWHYPLPRSIAALLMTVGFYLTYHVTVVPFITPRPRDAVMAQETPQTGETPRRMELAELFPMGAWELRSPKILEIGQTKLLLSEYNNLGGGKVQIKPCTLIMVPDGPIATRAERLRESVVMQAPQGAVLHFDSPLDLRQAKVGKLIGGQLVGPITIRSAGSKPDDSDDLLVETSEVSLTKRLIQSSEKVRFRWGPSHGQAEGLVIELLGAENDANADATEINGIRSIELVKKVQMHMVLPEKTQATAPSANDPTAMMAGSGGEPIDITCEGAFNFDLMRYVASFSQHVDVFRNHQQGAGDHLACERLEIKFVPVDGETPDPNAKKGAVPKLKPYRVVAFGDPVVVRSPSQAMEARGQILGYDLEHRRLSLRDREAATLTQARGSIRAAELYYQQPEAPSQVGQFLALGSGHLEFKPEQQGAADTITISWNESMRLRRDGTSNLHVLSLDGGGSVQSSQHGKMSADGLHLWLREELAAGTAGEVSIVPDRMLAEGTVNLYSEQLTGQFQRMEVWFERISKSLMASARPQTGAVPGPPPIQPAPLPGGAPPVVAPPPVAQAPARKFALKSRLLQMQVEPVDGQISLSKALLEDEVRVREISSATEEKPLVLTGSRVQMEQKAGSLLAEVQGQLAHVEGRGMTMDAPTIHVDSGTNRVWVDQAGTMTLTPDANNASLPGGLAGASGGPAMPAASGPLRISWNKWMQVQGRQAVFGGGVQGLFDGQKLFTEQMQVLFTQPIELGPKSQQPAGGKVDVQQVVCSGGVRLIRETYQGNQLSSSERLDLSTLTLNQLTGDILGAGPGEVMVMRLGGSGLQLPGTPAPQPQQSNALTALRVHFTKEMTGNMRREQLTFSDEVTAIYAPIGNWNHVPSFDLGDPANSNAVLLTSTYLTVNSTNGILPGKRSFELTATDRAVVESSDIRARGQVLSYSQAKDLLTLQGDGRTDAELVQRGKNGGQDSRVAARQIRFWRTEGRIQIDDARVFDVSERPEGSRR